MRYYILLISIALHGGISLSGQTVTDIDGNIYTTVTIGQQTWMQENLRTTRFNNGKVIPTTSQILNNDSGSVFQWAYGADSAIARAYGRLYTWYVASHRCQICPAGWRVPGEKDWLALTAFLGGDSIAGGKLKESGLTYWWTSDSSTTNSSSFNGRGAGARGGIANFYQLDSIGVFWSSDLFGNGSFPRGYTRHLMAHNAELHSSVAVGSYGASIRCIKDEAIGLPQGTAPRLKVYPNPAREKLYIEWSEDGPHTLQIDDSSGRRVLEKPLSRGFHSIDIRHLPGGKFSLRITGLHTTVPLIWIKN